jgi:sugar phosphate isomerase/epimerase
MCPLPDEIPPDRASPDYYSLSSHDETERKTAVAIAKNTLVYAKRFNAKAVVLHAGRVDLRDRTRFLASIIDDTDRLVAARGEAIRERREKADGCIDNVIRSMEELVPFAKGLGVNIGVENRYYYREIPIMEEFEKLFARFKPGELYYWHDVGHAEVFDRLGLASHKGLLDRFSHRLLGIHLHDIIGPITDHQAPGMGTFDFAMIKPYITPETIKVLEVHSPATADQIRRGAEMLMKVLS